MQSQTSPWGTGDWQSTPFPSLRQNRRLYEKTWQERLERLYNLRRDKRGSHERPHKPVLLLSILDALD
jgi:hypothetical protein